MDRMTFPTNNDATDPDPTTQIAWPSRPTKRVRLNDSVEVDRARARTMPPEATNSDDLQRGGENGKEVDSMGKRMSTWDLVKLSISMAGAQIAWTVELG